ncbi:MAG: UvrD-helicase domain-containing protein, partial [Deltaproteobacteria bacterium]|nr:UvrD-helicase domain-containing protein [Deltaproteobacteria bacterium]
MKLTNIESPLNPEQLAAVMHGQWPLLVIAGAGTGKTKVITHRIAHLIESGINPNQILALTFTEKAAGEMEERVDRLVPYGYSNVWISTFHSFGDRILRDNALEIGLTPDFRVLSEAERIIFLKEHIFELPLNYYRPLGNPTKYISAVAGLISRLKDEDVGSEEYMAYAEGLKKLKPGRKTSFPGLSYDTVTQGFSLEQQDELAKTYAKYQELMAKHGYLDFGDQVVLPLKLFRTRPHILKRYQEKFKYILVDEFQDTNYAQFQLVRLLAERHKNITVVGDDDQSIYKFRGAAVSNVLGFQKLYPDAKLITLTKNYRSVQPVLDAAYRLISHNNPDRLEVKSGIDKKLTSEKQAMGNRQEAIGKPIAHSPAPIASVKHLHFDTLTKEAETVAEMIERKVASCRMQDAGKNLKLETCDLQLSYKNFAILVRANSDAEPFLKALKSKGIPHRFSGNQGLYSKEEIRLLIAFLKAITDFNDSMNLFHLASSEVYQLKAADLIPCHNISQRSHKPLYYVMKEQAIGNGQEAIGKPIAHSPSPIASLTDEGLATITKLVHDIDKYSQMALSETVGKVLYSFLTDTGYLTRLSQENSVSAMEKVQNIARFFELTQRMEATLQVKKATAFVEYLNILMEAGDNPGTAEPDVEADWVQVLTVHKAKGLEFPVVFMVSLVADRFPRKERKEQIEVPDALIKDILPGGDFHLQEERRLFYVGMTRAMSELYLTSASDYGGVRAKKISQFVLEALDMPKAETTTVKTKPLEAIKRFAPAVGEGLVPSQLLPSMPDDAVLSLSYYQIDDYLTCPLKYKYIHILKVPLLPHHTVMYGKAMHDVISTYFRHKIEGKPPELDELISVFHASWRSAGFVTKEHEMQRYEAGKEAIKKFYEGQKQNGINPAAVEREFVIDLPFRGSASKGVNRLKGRWDLIEEREDGPYIIDFKTSDVREEKAAKKKAKESIQLMLYALAYKENFKKLPAGCELHFLESGLIGKAAFEDKHI